MFRTFLAFECLNLNVDIYVESFFNFLSSITDHIKCEIIFAVFQRITIIQKRNEDQTTRRLVDL